MSNIQYPIKLALDALVRIETAVDWHLGRSSFTQTKQLKGFEHSTAVRKELFAAHDEVRNTIAALQPAAANIQDPIKLARDALWVCAEHNALHFGEDHNTVQQARAAIAALQPAAAQPQGDGQDPFETWALQFAGEPWKITPLNAWQAASTQGFTAHDMATAAADGFRAGVASTQASEPSAVQVWHEGEPPHPWNTEWFIAETTYGGRVVLRQLPQPQSYEYTTDDGTYMQSTSIKRWMQFPDSEFVPFRASLTEPELYAIYEAHNNGPIASERWAYERAVIDAFCKKNGITTTPAANGGA